MTYEVYMSLFYLSSLSSFLHSHLLLLPLLSLLPLLLPLQLLIGAIKRNYQEEHYCQFASQLLIMTLNFLTRMIKSQALREQSPDSRQSSPDVDELGL